MVRYLVERGARVDAISRDGNSPADMAFGPSRFFIPKPDTVDLLVALRLAVPGLLPLGPVRRRQVLRRGGRGRAAGVAGFRLTD